MNKEIFDLGNKTFLDILWRFAFNIVILIVLIRFIYFKYERKDKFLFTYFMLGIVTFFICSILGNVYIEIGMGFSLFAIFGILRLRTRNFGIKDMAYIFCTIGISLINSLKVLRFPLLGIIIFNGIIVLTAFLLEEYTLRNRHHSHLIVYDNLEYLKPDKAEKLIKDISYRMGKEIIKVEVIMINYRKGVAKINVHYKD